MDQRKSGMNEIERIIEETLDTIVDPCSAAIGKPVGLKSMGLAKRLGIDRRLCEGRTAV